MDLKKYVVGLFKRVFERNARLLENEELFRLLVEGVEDYAIYGLDPEGRVLTWNSGAQRLKGYAAAEIIGEHFSRFYTEEGIRSGKPAELLRRAIANVRVRDEGWRVRKDGSVFFAEVVITALKNKAGVIRGFTKITRDITERKELDQKLLKSQAQLMEAQRIAHLGSWEWDVGLNVLSWSDEMYRIHGLLPQAFPMRASQVLRYVHPEDRKHVKNLMREAFKTHAPFSIHYRIVKADGKERFLHAMGHVVGHAFQDPVRLIGTLQDVTQQKEAERALQQKEGELFQAQKLEALGRLAGGVAHDFNNLMTGILGIGMEVKESFPREDPRRKEMEELVKASNRAFEVTRQLLAFGRRQLFSPKVINLNETIRDFANILNRLIGEDIKLDLQLQDPGFIRMDPGQMGQVLLNLVLNARDAMPNGGVIVIHLAHEGSNVALQVSDTGIGMDTDTLGHIFEPFFSTKVKDHGTGLGLATVYGIIKQSHGEISVSSRVAAGTTFKISLPRELELPAGQDANPQKNPEKGSGTILVVEDEDIVRRVVTRRLRNAGYTVLEAGDPATALATFEHSEHLIDLILTDVVMPGMNGRELVERLHKTHPSTAALYMSGYSEEIIATRGILHPGINFIEKTQIQKNLIQAVHDALQKKALVAARKSFL